MPYARRRAIFESMSPLEIAMYIKKQIEKGTSQREIAKTIGYSPAHVSKHLALLDMPLPFKHIFEKTKDVTLIFGLLKEYEKDPSSVTTLLEHHSKLTRADLLKLSSESHIKQIYVTHNGKSCIVIPDKKPIEPGNIVIRPQGSRTLIEVPAKNLPILKVVWD